MQKFRKKPVVVEAVQLTDKTFDAPLPNPEHVPGVVYDPRRRCAYIHTQEGRMQADIGDWIIRGERGDLYPCAPDFFAAVYEPEKITHRNCGASMRRFVAPGDMPRSWERDRTMTRPGPKQAGG